MRYLLLAVIAFCAINSFSQGTKNLGDDYPKLDTTDVLFERSVHNSEYDEVNDTSYAEDDTSHPDTEDDHDESDLEDVERPKKVFLDSSITNPLVIALLRDSLYWINIDTNFAVFDSMAVNPYGFNVKRFKDTLDIALYEDNLGATVSSWSMPLPSSLVNSNFGLRHYKWHYGTDLNLSIGDSVFACFDGVVRISKYNPGGYGNYIMVRHHNGLETLYGHLDKQLVGVGEHVKAGQLIGWGGNTGRSTGPHLHFEVRFRGVAMDAAKVFDFPNHTLHGPVLRVSPKTFSYATEMSKARYHKIRPGDTLSGIAVKYHTTVTRICKLNRISRNTILRVGRKIRVR